MTAFHTHPVAPILREKKESRSLEDNWAVVLFHAASRTAPLQPPVSFGDRDHVRQGMTETCVSYLGVWMQKGFSWRKGAGGVKMQEGLRTATLKGG